MKRSEVLKKIREKQREIALEVAKEALKELGITPDKKFLQEKSPNIRRDVNDFDIGLLYFLGWSPYRIGNRFGISPSAVKYRLQKMGIYEYTTVSTQA